MPSVPYFFGGVATLMVVVASCSHQLEPSEEPLAAHYRLVRIGAILVPDSVQTVVEARALNCFQLADPATIAAVLRADFVFLRTDSVEFTYRLSSDVCTGIGDTAPLNAFYASGVRFFTRDGPVIVVERPYGEGTYADSGIVYSDTLVMGVHAYLGSGTVSFYYVAAP